MRDPAVLAVFALRVTAAEFATVASSAPIVRTRRLPHPAPRGMSSPMPAAPMGTITPARDWEAYA